MAHEWNNELYKYYPKAIVGKNYFFKTDQELLMFQSESTKKMIRHLDFLAIEHTMKPFRQLLQNTLHTTVGKQIKVLPVYGDVNSCAFPDCTEVESATYTWKDGYSFCQLHYKHSSIFLCSLTMTNSSETTDDIPLANVKSILKRRSEHVDSSNSHQVQTKRASRKCRNCLQEHCYGGGNKGYTFCGLSPTNLPANSCLFGCPMGSLASTDERCNGGHLNQCKSQQDVKQDGKVAKTSLNLRAINEDGLTLIKQKLDSSDVVSYAYSIKIMPSDLAVLQNVGVDGWLNDEIINFYGHLIADKAKEFHNNGVCLHKKLNPSAIVEKEKTRPCVHVMNTFFVLKYNEFGYAGVKKWTKKVLLNLIIVGYISVGLSNNSSTLA
jgi:hypothetical protein